MTTRKVGAIGWKILGLCVTIASLIGGAVLSEGKRVDTGIMLIPVICGTAFWAGLIILFAQRPAYVLFSASICIVSCLAFFGCSNTAARSAFMLLFGDGVLVLGLTASLYVLLAYAFEEGDEAAGEKDRQPGEQQPQAKPRKARQKVLKKPL